MVRIVLTLGVLTAALTVYALVDAAMSDPRRCRGISKPLWIAVIALLPVVGLTLWFTLGRGKAPSAPRPPAPEDDPAFRGLDSDIDARIQELEAQLAALDAEEFPTGAHSTPGASVAEPAASEATASEAAASEATASEAAASEAAQSKPATSEAAAEATASEAAPTEPPAAEPRGDA